MITPYFLSADWGTSNLRLRLVEPNPIRVLAEQTGANGCSQVYNQWHQSNHPDRQAFYQRVLLDYIQPIRQKLSLDLGGVPLLISGMASSSLGMAELSYARAPLSLDPANLIIRFSEARDDFPHPLYLISGVDTPQDVMRGEETQLLGFLAQHPHSQGICILPGTHSKHAEVQHGYLANFRTYMTGELFALLTQHSTLKNALACATESSPEAYASAFAQGLEASAGPDWLHRLFQVRVQALHQSHCPEENYYFLSGLLLGSELKNLSNYVPPTLYLLAQGKLGDLYFRALEWMGLDKITQYASLPDTSMLTAWGHQEILNYQG